MSDSNDPIKFIVSPALEFSAAMLIMSNAGKNMALAEETGVAPDEKLFELGRYAAGKCSSFLQKEMHFFMDQDKWSLPHISPINSLPFRFALENPAVDSVPDLTRCVEAAEEGQLLAILGRETFGGKSDITADAFLKKAHSLPPEEAVLKQKLLECLENPAETLQRLAFVMKQFYESAYRSFEDGILSETSLYRDKYEELFKKDPFQFVGDYFNADIRRGKKQLRVFVSFFMQAGILAFPGTAGLPDCFIMGIHSEKRFGSQFIRAKLLTFYKLLSDEKRFELFELLSERPRYVNELAEQLGLAAPTVSHHLNYFIRSGLVKSSREHHRQYYALDGKKVRDLLDASVRLFLKGR